MADLKAFDAPFGTFWVCTVCRLRSTNRARATLDGVSKNWGQSACCFLHATLAQVSDLVLDDQGLVAEFRTAEYAS